ncbi:hypothetical protein [Luteolibacter luteus]|uniref:DUF4402 domain-containing protein n=1 Tax=Luteolibacter luteus TaxID=2728835 RepID=A0A858RQX7_9BACT|nr:hypothetical protein [Luteolibacter luteus]QJE98333.1 hypothetical protein HHL09_21960 [Luteolibacter luteus]
MRTIVLQLFAICALFIPFHQVEAAKAPKPPAVFGQFPVGKTFTFTVTSKLSSATVGTQVIDPAPVPKGVPSFVVGQQVTFTIGKKGELKGPGFSILYNADGVTANTYVNKPKKGASPTVATVHKNLTTGEPTAVSLSFFTFKIAKRIPTVNTVTYVLQ